MPEPEYPLFPLAPIIHQLQPPADPGGEDEEPNDLELPQIGTLDENDLEEMDLIPTRGGNVAPRRHEINTDLNLSNIIEEGRRRVARVLFSTPTFDRCFALALLKPTVGSKLSELPPEPRNWRAFKIHPRRADLRLVMDDEYNALIVNQT